MQRRCYLFCGGDGTGKFTETPNSAADINTIPVNLLVTDLNGDNRLDVAFTDKFGKLEVQLRTPAGSASLFAPASGSPISLSSGTNLNKFAAPHDFNNDGKRDLVVTSTNGVEFLQGQGTGAFTRLAAVGAADTRAIVTGDFNRDGRTDIAVAGRYVSGTITGIAIMLNDSAGGYTVKLVQTADLAIDLVMRDFDNDGVPDLGTLIFTQAESQIHILRGSGDGTLGPYAASAADGWSYSFAAGEFNQDGKPDFVSGDYWNGTMHIWLNTCVPNTPPTIATPAGLARQSGGLAVRDAIAVVGDAEFAAGTLTVSASNIPAGISLTNFTNTNGTISAEVAATCNAALGNNAVTLTVTDGGGATATANFVVNVTANTPPTLAYQTTPHVVYLGDSAAIVPTQLASDTNPTQLSVAVLSKGTYTGTIRATPGGVSAAALALTTGDFNGDGKLDLASVNAANTVSIRLGDGLGNFTGAIELSFAGQTLRAATSNVLIRFGDGLGGFTNGPSVALTGDWTSIVTGDFNGDGKLDFALANPTTNKVNVLLASCNLIPPSITASPTLTRQQGSAAANAVLATVSDDRTAAGALTVTATTIPAGLTVANLVNANGTITAEVTAACNATVGTNNLVLQVTDGDSLTTTAIMVVNVTANTPPALDYPTLATGFANLALNLPAIPPPTDNGSVASLAVLNKGTYTGGIAVNAAGVVAFTNIAPIGLHTITMRATDNCGATRDVSFSFNVVCVPLTITTPPQPRTVSANANASFSVVANGVGMSYQWRKGGVALTNSTNLSGAQTATLILNGVTAASAGSYDVVVTTACNAVTSTSATLTVSNTPATLLVNEFRFSGPNGVDDWYVELYNNTAQPISTTGLKLNWVNAAGNQTGFVALTPNRTIQPRGYYLIAGADYSFTSVPADDTAPASAIARWLGGVLLCDAANAVFDAVGTTDVQRSGQTQFSEGTPVAALGAPAVQHAWVRKSATNGGAPQDTNHNQNDFALVATWAVPLNGVLPKLGAPGPQNLASPPLNNLGLPVTLLNPASSASSGPNAVVENVAAEWGETVFPRSLYLRRTLTNNTGKPVTKLRFRIAEISNGGVNTAILRALSASDITVNGQLVKGLTLETTPSPTERRRIKLGLKRRFDHAGCAVGSRRKDQRAISLRHCARRQLSVLRQCRSG